MGQVHINADSASNTFVIKLSPAGNPSPDLVLNGTFVSSYTNYFTPGATISANGTPFLNTYLADIMVIDGIPLR